MAARAGVSHVLILRKLAAKKNHEKSRLASNSMEAHTHEQTACSPEDLNGWWVLGIFTRVADATKGWLIKTPSAFEPYQQTS